MESVVRTRSGCQLRCESVVNPAEVRMRSGCQPAEVRASVEVRIGTRSECQLRCELSQLRCVAPPRYEKRVSAEVRTELAEVRRTSSADLCCTFPF